VFPTDGVTLIARAGVWPAEGFNLDAAASACSATRGALGEASYSARLDWLGAPYFIEGVFARNGPNRVVRLEVCSTGQGTTAARALLAAWLKKATSARLPTLATQ
jgi:hypothetical protein